MDIVNGEMDGEKIVRPETSFDRLEKIIETPTVDELEEEPTENEKQIAESDDYDLRTCHTV